MVIGVVLALGFLLLLLAFQAPVAAAIGVVTNLLATGAAFGVAKWIFQDGHLAGLLGFQPQGFVDAWAPVFFFAMIFAISMDYTVFLLSSAKEHWDAERRRSRGDGRRPCRLRAGDLAAGAVMVAVFFTFALSGPLPPKEMGVVLGIAVLLDAFVVRLLLMPVLLRLAGPAAWYLPRWLGRVLPDVRLRPRRRDPGSQPGLTPRRAGRSGPAGAQRLRHDVGGGAAQQEARDPPARPRARSGCAAARSGRCGPWVRRRAAPVLHHRSRDGEDYHHADDRADDPSEVEDVGVADA